MEILQALEASAFAMWVKESSTAYVAVLAFHTIGLAFLVGISGATALRVLGVARAIPLAPMVDFFPLMYVGFWTNLVTGTVLLTLYPTKYLVDATLYIKLAAVVVAVVLIRKLQPLLTVGESVPVEQQSGKKLASALLVVWMIAMTAGRVMAYGVATKLQTAAAVLVFSALALAAGYFVARSLGWIKSSKQVSVEPVGRG